MLIKVPHAPSEAEELHERGIGGPKRAKQLYRARQKKLESQQHTG
jgi:hypothetical protein